MADMVIAAYRPHAGCAAALRELARDHVPYLRRLGLVTDRPALVLVGQNDTIVEVFEWADGAIARAHAMPEIHALWERYAAMCDYVKLADLPEAADLFAQFKALDPSA